MGMARNIAGRVSTENMRVAVKLPVVGSRPATNPEDPMAPPDDDFDPLLGDEPGRRVAARASCRSSCARWRWRDWARSS